LRPKKYATQRDQSIPALITVGFPYAPIQKMFQSISSGVYLYIRQHLLAPTAGSLKRRHLKPNMLSEDIFLSVIAFLIEYDM